MKIRKGFVSNSSSSSFVIIGTSGVIDKLSPTEEWHPGILDLTIYGGEYEFGWGPGTMRGIYNRIAFAMLQCASISKIEIDWESPDPEGILRGSETDWGQMLIDLIKNESGLDLVWKLPRDSYIDHQSAASEGHNDQIFNNRATLKRFIYDHGSYIELDNDNH